MITVAKILLPDRVILDVYLDGIHESGWATNRGVILQELNLRLAEFLGVCNVVANVTLALQMACHASGFHAQRLRWRDAI